MEPLKKIRDRWGRDRDTGARGLEIGHRRVKNQRVKIGNEYFSACTGRGSLKDWEDKIIEVAVRDRLSTNYEARDPVTLDSIALLAIKKD